MDLQSYSIKKPLHSAGLFKDKHPTLPHLDVELTERCNNACIHCYINLAHNNKEAINRELKTEQWKDLLDQAASLGVLSIRFTGGEPLLRDDFADLYIHARRLGMTVFLFTNARLITEDLADLFKRIPPLKKIEISVYGMHAQSYDDFARAKGAYEEFRQGVDRLLERKIPIYLKSSLLPSNVTDEEDFSKWVATIPGMTAPTKLILLNLRTRRDSAVSNKMIKYLRLPPKECAALLTLNNSVNHRNFADNAEQFLYPKGERLFSHFGAGNTGCIDAYGNYQMCLLLRHPDMIYDLTKGSLKKAITNVIPHLRETRAKNPEYLKRCAQCFLLGLCEQCPAKSWSEYGTLDTPVEYLCEVAHTQAHLLGLLTEDERAWEIKNWQERVENAVQKAKCLSLIENSDQKPSLSKL